MTLEMTYFHAELVQLIVSRSDLRTRSAEIRHEVKILWLLIPSCLEDELWMRQPEKLSPNRRIGFLKTELRKPNFLFLNFEVGSVRFLENRYPTLSSGSAHPYKIHSVLFNWPIFLELLQSLRVNFWEMLWQYLKVTGILVTKPTATKYWN